MAHWEFPEFPRVFRIVSTKHEIENAEKTQQSKDESRLRKPYSESCSNDLVATSDDLGPLAKQSLLHMALNLAANL